MRVFFLLLAASVIASSTAAAGNCTRNGGTLCNVPGNVSQVAATWYTLNLTNPSGPDNYISFMAVAWADDRNASTSGSDIYMNSYASCLDSTGASGSLVVDAPGDQTSPVIIQSGWRDITRLFQVDDFGVIVAWEDHRGPDADIYARRFFGDPRSTPAPWDSGGIAICGAPGDQTSPSMVVADHGGAILGWTDERAGSRDVYAQLVDSAGIGLWGQDGTPVCVAGGDLERLRMAADNAGGAYFCWLDHRSRDALYAVRLTREGGLANGWNADGNLVADGVELVNGPLIIVDANGLAVSWTDARHDADGDVFLQRLGPDGAAVAGWPSEGIPVAAGTGAQRMDDFVSVDAGGSFVVWESEPAGGGDVDLYASRVDGNGATVVGWPAPVCVTAGRQDHARGCFNSGGLYVVFSDDRAGERDLYATRLLPDGRLSLGWKPNGIVVSNAPDAQDFPLLVPVVSSSVHAAWIDYRDRATNDSDLYGASINAAGWVGIAPSATSRLSFGAPRPNPARAGAAAWLDLAEARHVDVDVLDCAGRHVRTLVAATLDAGRHRVAWDGRTERGTLGPPGVYFVRARVGDASLQHPLVVIR